MVEKEKKSFRLRTKYFFPSKSVNRFLLPTNCFLLLPKNY